MDKIKLTEQAILINSFNNRECLVQTIDNGDIYRYPPHQKIYMAMIDMVESGAEVSFTSIISALPKISMDVMTAIMQSPATIREHKSILRNATIDYNKEQADKHIKQYLINREKGVEDLELLTLQLESIQTGRNVDIFHDFNDVTKLEITETFSREYFISTGIPQIDNVIVGLGKTDLVTIAGMPGGGKTTLALNMAFNNPKTLLMSYEMSIRVELYAKALSYFSGINSMKIINPEQNVRLSDIELKALDDAKKQIRALNLRMAEKPVNFSTLIPAIRHEVNKNRPPLIIIDYLQLIPSEGRSQEERITAMTNKLKALAKDLEIPIIILSQFTKEGYKDGRRPTMADLRGSGAIAQDSNSILICHDGKIFVEKSRMTVTGEVPNVILEKATGRYKYGYFTDEW